MTRDYTLVSVSVYRVQKEDVAYTHVLI